MGGSLNERGEGAVEAAPVGADTTCQPLRPATAEAEVPAATSLLVALRSEYANGDWAQGGIALVDARTGAVQQRLGYDGPGSQPPNPNSIFATPDGGRLFVADGEKGIVEVSPDLRSVVANHGFDGWEPLYGAVAANGFAYVLTREESRVLAFDLARTTWDRADAMLGERDPSDGLSLRPQMLALGPNGKDVWTSHAGTTARLEMVSVYDASADGFDLYQPIRLYPRYLAPVADGAFFTGYNSTMIGFSSRENQFGNRAIYVDAPGPSSSAEGQIGPITATADGAIVAYANLGRAVIVVLRRSGTGWVKAREIPNAGFDHFDSVGAEHMGALALDRSGSTLFVARADAQTVSAIAIGACSPTARWSTSVPGVSPSFILPR